MLQSTACKQYMMLLQHYGLLETQEGDDGES